MGPGGAHAADGLSRSRCTRWRSSCCSNRLHWPSFSAFCGASQTRALIIPIETAPPDIAARAAAEQKQLDRSLIHGIAWTGALRWFAQVLSWSSTLIIARILTPADFGLVGMAMLYVGFIQLINEFGLGAAIIRRRDLTEPQISAVGGVSLGLSLGLWALSAAFAPLVAHFFSEPRVQPIIVLVSFIFITTGLKVVPRSLLSRDLQFKRVAAIDATEAAAATLTMLVLALSGMGYWSLPIGTVAGSTVSAGLALRWRRHRLSWPRDLRSISESLSFGSHIAISRIAWYLYSNADFTVVGKVLGTAAYGAYEVGWTLASVPVDRVSALVGQVTPAVFSSVQNDPAALRRYLLRLTEGLAFITLPASIGLAMVADDFVLVALGDRWWAAMLPLALLAFYGGFRSLTTIYPHILQAVGQSRRAMNFTLLALVVLPPLFYLGTRWGAAGVAAAWVVGYPLVTVPLLRAVLQVTETSLSEYIGAIRPALLGSTLMAAAVALVDLTIPLTWPPALSLAFKVGVGALTYVAVMYLLFGKRIRALISMVKELRRR